MVLLLRMLSPIIFCSYPSLYIFYFLVLFLLNIGILGWRNRRFRRWKSLAKSPGGFLVLWVGLRCKYHFTFILFLSLLSSFLFSGVIMSMSSSFLVSGPFSHHAIRIGRVPVGQQENETTANARFDAPHLVRLCCLVRYARSMCQHSRKRSTSAPNHVGRQSAVCIQ